MSLQRTIDGAFIAGWLGAMHASEAVGARDVAYLLPWVVILPVLEVVPAYVCRRLSSLTLRDRACSTLDELHAACGYAQRTSLLIRGFLQLQCGLTGLTLWRANAPGWVSLAALSLLAGLYLAWFWRRRASVLGSEVDRCVDGHNERTYGVGVPRTNSLPAEPDARREVLHMTTLIGRSIPLSYVALL